MTYVRFNTSLKKISLRNTSTMFAEMQLELSFVEEPKEEYGEIFIQGPHRTRKMSYLTPGIPRLIIEGKWLVKKYSVRVGAVVNLEYHRDRIVIKFK